MARRTDFGFKGIKISALNVALVFMYDTIHRLSKNRIIQCNEALWILYFELYCKMQAHQNYKTQYEIEEINKIQTRQSGKLYQDSVSSIQRVYVIIL